MKSKLLDLMWYNVGIMRKELFCSFNTIMYAKCCPILTAKFSYWVPKLLKLFHFRWFLVTWERKAREFNLFSISSSWAMRAEEWNKGRKREKCKEDLCLESKKTFVAPTTTFAACTFYGWMCGGEVAQCYCFCMDTTRILNFLNESSIQDSTQALPCPYAFYIVSLQTVTFQQ